MAIPLKIKALCINFGYCEGLRSASMFVAWSGRPAFTDPAVALYSFVDACRAQCQAVPRPLGKCCKETLKRNAKAKACEACGNKTAITPEEDYDLEEYLQNLLKMDCDSFGDKAYPMSRYAGSDDGSCRIGDWTFFQGLPCDCDVVEVENLDLLFSGSTDEAEYRVIHVGKAATRASSMGAIRLES